MSTNPAVDFSFSFRTDDRWLYEALLYGPRSPLSPDFVEAIIARALARAAIAEAAEAMAAVDSLRTILDLSIQNTEAALGAAAYWKEEALRARTHLAAWRRQYADLKARRPL